MEIDSRFPTKLDSVSDAPEPLRSAVEESLASPKSVRLLVHAPAFYTVDEKSPATVLAVNDSGWLVASETEEGGASIEKSNFSDTLFLELTSILLSGRLRICFATVGTSYSATMTFDTVGEELYREAIDLMLNGIDQTVTPLAENDGDATSISEAWPLKFRTETERYRPKGSAVFGRHTVVGYLRRLPARACSRGCTSAHRPRTRADLGGESISSPTHWRPPRVRGNHHLFSACATSRLPPEPSRAIRRSCSPGACNARWRKTRDHLPV